MRGSHGSSIDVFGPPIVPGGSDVEARSPDINGGTKVGERGFCVIDGRSGDGNRLRRAGRRVSARVPVVVPGSYDDGNTIVVKLKTESLVSGVPATLRSLVRTALTALSIAREGPPPKLIETTEGLPVLATSSETHTKPEILEFGGMNQ